MAPPPLFLRGMGPNMEGEKNAADDLSEGCDFFDRSSGHAAYLWFIGLCMKVSNSSLYFGSQRERAERILIKSSTVH